MKLTLKVRGHAVAGQNDDLGGFSDLNLEIDADDCDYSFAVTALAAVQEVIYRVGRVNEEQSRKAHESA